MISTRSYLLKAFNDWILDNGCTPHVVVNAFFPGVHVPEQYIEVGQIVFNIAPSAVRDLIIDQESLSFSATFHGINYDIHVPHGALIGVFAKENGGGMVFDESKDFAGSFTPPKLTGAPKTPPQAPQKKTSAKQPTLTIVK